MRTSDWRQAWEDEAPDSLRPWHRRVLCALAVSMGGNGGQSPTECRPGVDRIGRRCGYNQSRVREVLRELDQRGWISISHRHGAANRYYATVPTGTDIPEGTPVRAKRPKRDADPPLPDTTLPSRLRGLPDDHPAVQEWRRGAEEVERAFGNQPTSDERDKDRPRG